MAQQKYVIEIKVDLDNYDGDETAHEQRKEIMRTVTQRAAASVLATMNLMSLRRAPQVAVTAGDYFMGKEEIEVVPSVDLM